MLSVTKLTIQCFNAEFRVFFIVLLSVVMLTVVSLNVMEPFFLLSYDRLMDDSVKIICTSSWRHKTQLYDTQHNDIQHNDTQ
jgi:hypothetical protein